jgi:salicylate hydroxylase
MPAVYEIAIVGAGIGGLTAALALLGRGHDVTVYEQASELGELGAGLQLAANGSRVLRALGLEERMEEIICEAEWKEVRVWSTGVTRKLFDLGADSRERFGAPYWFVHRGDFHRVLREAVAALKPDAIQTGARVESHDENGDRVSLRLASGQTAEFDIVIGADGVHSTLRGQMFESPTANFSGLVAWRGLIDMDRLPDELRRPVGTNWVGPHGHVVTYPLRSGKILNFVGVIEDAAWRTESWSAKGTREECAARFPGWHPYVQAMIEAIDQPFKWALVGRDPLPRWSIGRTTLLGDACHPTLPFLAQGANMAVEDALVLSRCLDHFGQDPTDALRRYEDLRVERCTRIVQGSAANADRFHNPVLADADEAEAYLDREWAPDKVRLRYDWLFEHDVTRIPIDTVQSAGA